MIDAQQWLSDAAADHMRAAIAEAGGDEVFFRGRMVGERVSAVEVIAIGNRHAVNAFVDRVGPGQIMLHNHPGGDLRPSAADLDIAGRAGAHGAGFLIVDNAVTRVRPVVLPWTPETFVPLDAAATAALLGLGGPLAAGMPGYQVRQGQIALCEAISRRLSEGGAGVFEAGTGIGKSFAYLLPAIRMARANDTTVVVSTATLALQSQLVEKDVPALAAALGETIRAVVLKGRSNYVSLRRAEAWLRQAGETPEAATVTGWLDRTTTGEFTEVEGLIDPEVRDQIQSESDNCLRARCPRYNECHYFNSRRRAAAAHLVVVNHALLAADLAIRRESGMGMSETMLLPPFQHLVIDEAHNLEPYARQQFGARTSELAIVRSLRQLSRPRGKMAATERLRAKLADRVDAFPRATMNALMGLLEQVAAGCVSLQPTVSTWFSALSDWHDEVARGSSAVRLPATDDGFAALVEKGLELAVALEELSAVAAKVDELVDQPSTDLYGLLVEFRSRAHRLEHHAAALRSVLTSRNPAEVAWVERQGRGGRQALTIAPIDVGHLLEEAAWSRLRSVVLTSATLASGPDDFGLLERGLGLEGRTSDRIQIASPFDVAARMRLAVVRGLPVDGGPRHADWIAAVTQLVQASDGGALVLCTSNAAMRAIGNGLRDQVAALGIRVLVQGERPRSTLVRSFREDERSVLVAVASFWEGFDAAGTTLRHVIMPRLPFAVPVHPLEVARQQWWREQGLDGFRDLSLPEATMRFRQGVGRLLRTADDWGAITVLDERIETRGYGKRFLRAIGTAPAWSGPLPDVIRQLQRYFTEGPEGTDRA